MNKFEFNHEVNINKGESVTLAQKILSGEVDSAIRLESPKQIILSNLLQHITKEVATINNVLYN